MVTSGSQRSVYKGQAPAGLLSFFLVFAWCAAGNVPVCASALLHLGEACAEETEFSLLQHDLQRGGSGGAATVTDHRRANSSKCTGLDCLLEYVGKDDAAYTWKDTSARINGSVNGSGWTGYILSMTSQKWLPDEVDPPLWVHRMVVIIPDKLEIRDWCSLYLSYYTTPDVTPTATDADVAAMANLAVETSAPAAVLLDTPPISGFVFAADPSGEVRVEDSLLAYGWQQFSKEPSRPELLVELPMAKAVVRAIDTLEAFIGSGWNDGKPLRFAVAGHSKRAASSWHAAAVDPRVHAIISMARSLNLRRYIHRVQQSLGSMPYSCAPYNAMAFANNFTDSVEGLLFEQITDPSQYATKFATLSKFVISASSDDFFTPDHLAEWWAEIPGPKVNLMIPNNGHMMELMNVVPTIGAFLQSVYSTRQLPEIDWEIANDTGAITVRQVAGSDAPVRVELWKATTCSASQRRDFREHNNDQGEECELCGEDHSSVLGLLKDPYAVAFGTCLNTAVEWRSSPLQRTNDDAVWVAQVGAPTDGSWTGFFVRFEFASNYVVSTEVSIVPDTFPYPDCGKDCTQMGLVLQQVSKDSK